MIKIKLGELVNAEKEGAFVEVAKLDLKLKDAIRVTKLFKKITEEVVAFNTAKDDNIKKYGTEVDGVVSINAQSEHWNNFIAEIAEVEQQEIELDFEPIAYESLNENVQISPKTLLILHFLFV
mgnify:FL=1